MAKKTTKVGKIAITQVRSGIGRPAPQKRTLEALGFTKHQQTLIHDDSPSIRGMIGKVSHLVTVVPFEE
jgi:large subunit ribosomal protein L30